MLCIKLDFIVVIKLEMEIGKHTRDFALTIIFCVFKQDDPTVERIKKECDNESE